MQNYLDKLREFTADNRIPRDVPSRVRKAGEEWGEVAESAAHFCARPTDITLACFRAEIADTINVAVDMLLVLQPRITSEALIAFLTANLEQKAEKYRNGENRTEERT